MRIGPFLLCLLVGVEARAQVPGASDAPIAAPSVELAPGEPVRVGRDTGLLEGRLLGTSAEFLTLELRLPGPRLENVPVSEVRELSVRKRSTGYGALIGAGTGFLGGGLLGLYVCGIPESISTGDCLLLTGGGAAAGALLSAGLGAFIGYLIPRWERVYERALDGPLLLSSVQAPEGLRAEGAGGPSEAIIGQLRLFASAVFTVKEPADAIGPGVRVQALAQLGRHIAVGPEMAFHYLFTELDGSPLQSPLASFGVLMRAAPRPSVLTPSLLIGFSVHTAGQPATYSVGAGLDWVAAEGLPLAFELRWHQFNVPWKDGRQLTLGAGTRVFW